jgi:hypothetical protein
MKKLIGVAIILLTLVLSVIYRQMTHRPAAVSRVRTQETVLLSLLVTI